MSRWRIPIACGALAVGHLAFVIASGRLRVEHVIADALLLIVPWLGERGRAFAAGGLWLALVGILYDNQRLLMPLRGEIHTGDLRALDLALFGGIGGVTWPEVFARHHNVVLDVLCAFPYATHIFELFGAVVVLFFMDALWFRRLCLAFFVALGGGILVYMLYPAAPPWYVIAHGLGPADPSAAASAAGAARVDALLGVNYFASFYRRNANVFAAMPSLHVAFPILVAWTLGRMGPVFRAVTIGFAALMSFAAIYLVHHWVIDVVAGYAIAAVACWVAQRVIRS